MSTRRNFLKGMGAVGGLGLLNPLLVAAKAPARPAKAKYMAISPRRNCPQ